MKALRALFFESDVSTFDQRNHSKFSHCCTGLQLTGSFIEHFKENNENTIYVQNTYLKS